MDTKSLNEVIGEGQTDKVELRLPDGFVSDQLEWGDGMCEDRTIVFLGPRRNVVDMERSTKPGFGMKHHKTRTRCSEA